MLSIELTFIVVVFIGNIFLGLFTYYKNPRSTTNTLFFLFTLALALYIGINYLTLQPFSNAVLLFWIRMTMAVALMINFLFFLLVHAFPQSTLKINKIYYWGAVAATYLLVPLSQTSLIFPSLRNVNGTPQPVVGQGMALFLLHTIVLLGSGIFTLIRKYIHAEGIEKKQLKLFLIGTFFMFFSILISNVVLVVIFNISTFVGLLPLYIFIFVACVSYAIIRHRFLDIRLIVARSIAYTLLVILLILSYSVVLFTISTYITGVSIPRGNLITSTILTLIVAFSLQPLRRIFEKVTSRYLYKDMYNTNTLLSDISHVIASSLELEHLSRGLFSILSSQMKVSHAVLVLTKDRSLVALQRYGDSGNKTYFQEDLLYLLEKSISRGKENVAVFEELPEGKEKKTMRDNNITLVIPLKVKHEIVGAIFLGDKASGDIYSSEDINILKIIAPEAAVGVKNALAYDEIKRFNITLREEVRHATQKLKKANERLKELDELKDEFVSLASHELRTPMTAIKSYVWMAMSQLPKSTDPQIHKYLDISYQSTERLIQLVNEMLTVSRIERGKIELNMEKVDVNNLLQQAYDELKIRADEQHIDFVLSSDVPKLSIIADKDKLREVLQNIIGNALKFTPEKGKIMMKLTKTDGQVQISISDTGPGIAKDDIHKLFGKFSKIDYSYSKKANIHGTGLGLYISKQIISLHKGDIIVESQLDIGTTFTVVLPI